MRGSRLMKEAEHGAQIDLPNQAGLLVVTLVRRLAGFAVHVLVIGHLQPGRQDAVQVVQREDLRRRGLPPPIASDRSERSVRSGRRPEDRAAAGARAGC